MLIIYEKISFYSEDFSEIEELNLTTPLKLLFLITGAIVVDET